MADPGHLVEGGDFLGGWISRVIFRTWIMMLILYRHPSEAKVSDYCFPSVYFFIHRSCSETTRPIFATFTGIVYYAKTAKICSKIQGLTQIFDYSFKTVKENSNLKTTWTMGIVYLHFWRILFRTVKGQLRSSCPIGWENLYFCQFARFALLIQKLLDRFAQNYLQWRIFMQNK